MALADTARLIASLELQDKFSQTAAKYEKTLGQMERRTSTLEQVGFQIGRGARNVVDNVKRIGVVAGAFVASQVALGVKSLVQLEEVKNQTDAVIKSTGGAANVTAEQIRTQAEALEELSTVDDKAIQAGQNMLLTFTDIRNEVGEGNDIFNQATQAVLDLSVAMGTEPKQAALQLGKALNDPVKGLTALRRVGIQFTDQQADQIEAMVESGHKLEAQKVIIAELNKEFGGSAKAFGEGPGATMRRFGDAVEGAQQALATGFLPVMERVSDLVQDTLKDPKVLANIKTFGEGLAGGVEDLIDIGLKLPWDAIGQSAKLMGQGAKALLDAFTGLPPWIQTAVLTGWGLNKLTGGALGNIAAILTKSAFGSLRGSTPATPVFTKEVGVGGLGGPGGPLGGGSGLLLTLAKLTGVVGLFIAAAEGLKLLQETIDPNAISRKEEFDRTHGGIFNLFPEKVSIEGGATPLGQFVQQNLGGTPVPTRTTQQGSGADNAAAIGIKSMHQDIVRALERGDTAEARRLKEITDGLRAVRGKIDQRVNDIIPYLGRTNRALSVANRSLDDGNSRQRDIAQRISEARDRIGAGFQESNANLRSINAKDFSPNVSVTTNVSTAVSVSDIVRSVTHASFASQVGQHAPSAGFTP